MSPHSILGVLRCARPYRRLAVQPPCRSARLLSVKPLTSIATQARGLDRRRFGSTLTLPTSDSEQPPETAADASEIPPGYSVGHLYFDSVFPLTLGLFDPRAYISALRRDAHLDDLRRVLPDQENVGFGFRVIGVESR